MTLCCVPGCVEPRMISPKTGKELPRCKSHMQAYWRQKRSPHLGGVKVLERRSRAELPSAPNHCAVSGCPNPRDVNPKSGRRYKHCAEHRKPRKRVEVNPGAYRRCEQCQRKLPSTEQYFKPYNNHGLRRICRECEGATNVQPLVIIDYRRGCVTQTTPFNRFKSGEPRPETIDLLRHRGFVIQIVR